MKPLFTLLMSIIITVQVSAQWGDNDTRTDYRDNAGAFGQEIKSGFYQTADPHNFPAVPQPNQTGANWWHLLDVRHSNTTLNYAMQFSGSFFDQQLYFRKTSNAASQGWNRLLQDIGGKVAIGGTIDPATTKGNINLEAINVGNSTNPSYALKLDGHLIMADDKILYGAGGLTIQKYGGSWINFPTNGASGMGSGGPGIDPWIAYASTTKEWFPNAGQGDICYRNTNGKLLFGNSASQEAVMVVTGNKIGIGTSNPQEMLSVSGTILSKKVKVSIAPASFPDYVFEPSYKLPSLREVEAHIVKYKHLQDVPAAAEVEKDGLDIGSNQAVLLKKIEELTLYLIEQNKKIIEQGKKMERQQKEIDQLKIKKWK